MLMAASDCWRATPQPDEAQVEAALGGVLCRCTGYRKIVEAVLRRIANAAARKQCAAAASAPGIARGGRPGQADRHGTLRRRCRAGRALWSARRSARRTPRARFTLGDLARSSRRGPACAAADRGGRAGRNGYGIYPHIKDQPVLGRRARCAIAAIRWSPWSATRATVEAIRDDELPIAWEALPPLDRARRGAAERRRIHARQRRQRADRRRRRLAAMSRPRSPSAAHVAEAEYRDRLRRARLYRAGGRLGASASGDRIEVSSRTQAPLHGPRGGGAASSACRAGRCASSPTACGGGFGGKLDLAVQPLLAVAAWLTRQPVRAASTRGRRAWPAAPSATRRASRARLGCDADGRLTGFDFEGASTPAPMRAGARRSPAACRCMRTGPYRRAACVDARARAMFTNSPPSGAFRGFGVPQAAIAQEALLDALADAARHRPAGVPPPQRARAGDATATGQVLEHSRRPRRLPRGAAAALAATARRGGRGQCARRGVRRGVGVACMWYGIGNTGCPIPRPCGSALAPTAGHASTTARSISARAATPC